MGFNLFSLNFFILLFLITVNVKFSTFSLKMLYPLYQSSKYGKLCIFISTHRKKCLRISNHKNKRFSSKDEHSSHATFSH